MSTSPYERHVIERTIVLRDLRLMFLPVPKGGCTSLLWLLSELAELDPTRFARSARPEITAGMNVHDISLWRPEHRLAQYTEEERKSLFAEDGWLRFSVVRDPATRLWSAWQSKLLLREPAFVDSFGDQPWFPRIPGRPEDVIEDFRAFVAAVGEGAADVHWAVQCDLVEELPLDHVGRVERMSETLDRIREHVGADRMPDSRRHENRSPLPMPAHAYDDAGVEVLERVYARDYAAFGYSTATSGDGVPADEWNARVADRLELVTMTIAHSERIGQLHRVAVRRKTRMHNTTRKLQQLQARRGNPAATAALVNLEGEADYDVHWGWEDGPTAPGFTAVLRVRDEARSLPYVLGPLLRAVERVVVVDNASEDGTPEVARRTAAEAGAADRLDVFEYPFSIARCGSEHLATPAHSVHSLVHFYNWSFSHVRTSYALKWDGDMVLTRRGESVLRDLAWQLEAAKVVVKVPRLPLYVADGTTAFLDIGLRNTEPWGWPNRPGYKFVKAMDWEMPVWTPNHPTLTLPSWCCVELKYLDTDEFAHWSDTDFTASKRQSRKQREWEVFRALSGGGDPPREVVRIDAPDGEDVIEHIRDVWLPARAMNGGLFSGDSSSRSIHAADPVAVPAG